MFEPVHGSAPDIAGTGKANPVGAVWAGALMLDHLGETTAGSAIMKAVEEVLATTTIRTPDLGGTATTSEVGQELERAIRAAQPSGGS
jgi:tartrate dehydrogenase/decarboxylase/D-malate dehydrogenase